MFRRQCRFDVGRSHRAALKVNIIFSFFLGIWYRSPLLPSLSVFCLESGFKFNDYDCKIVDVAIFVHICLFIKVASHFVDQGCQILFPSKLEKRRKAYWFSSLF